MAKRTYSEQEIRDILGQAAERQEAARRAAEGARSGLTLEELQAVAAEAGIAPEFVAAAAMNRRPPAAEEQRILGVPATARRSRLIPGGVSDAAWAAFVREARDHFKRRGIAEELGDVREWVGTYGGESGGSYAVHLTVQPEGDGTRVTLAQDYKEALTVGVALPAILALIGVVGLLMGDRPDGGIVGAWLVALGLAVMAAIGLWGRVQVPRQERRFEAFLDRLELLAQQAPEGASTGAEGRAAPALDLDALDRHDVGAPAAERSRRRTRG